MLPEDPVYDRTRPARSATLAACRTRLIALDFPLPALGAAQVASAAERQTGGLPHTNPFATLCARGGQKSAPQWSGFSQPDWLVGLAASCSQDLTFPSQWQRGGGLQRAAGGRRTGGSPHFPFLQICIIVSSADFPFLDMRADPCHCPSMPLPRHQ